MGKHATLDRREGAAPRAGGAVRRGCEHAGARQRLHFNRSRALERPRGRRRDCVCVLVANGVRLSTVRKDHREFITPELEAFEKGVLRCRAAVVAMLYVKRAGKLWRCDKFLLREIGFAIWATRWNNEWQKT